MEPVQEIAPPPVRDRLIPEAYAMLGFLYVGILAMVLYSVFGTKEPGPKAPSAMDESGARVMLVQEALAGFVREASPAQYKTIRKQTDESYQTIIEGLEKKNKPANRKLLVGLYSASGRPVPKEDLAWSIPPTTEQSKALQLATGSASPADIEAVANWKAESTSDRLMRIGALRKANAEAKIGPLMETSTLLGLGALGAALGLVFTVGVIVVLLVAANWSKFVASLRGFACGNLSNVMGSELAIRSTLFLLLYVLSGLPFRYLPTERWPDGVSTLAHGLVIVAVALGSAAVPLFGNGGLRRIWGSVPFKEGMQVALCGLCANAPLLLLTLPVITLFSKFLPDPSHPINNELNRGASPMETIAILIVGSVCAPIAEETVFRGMLFPSLSKLFKSPIWGGLAQGFMFASIHPQGPAAWLSLMAIGCMCSMVTYRAGAQWPSMVLHGIHNGLLLLLNIAISRL